MEDQINIIEWRLPKYPAFTAFSDRLETFIVKAWPPGIIQKPQDIANAGMFYTGTSDYVICYYCGNGLYKWEPTDSVLFEHARHYPDCGYLNLIASNDNIEIRNLSEKRDSICISIDKIINLKSIFKKIGISNTMTWFPKCCKKVVYNNKDSQDTKRDYFCKLCVEREANTLFLPCSHMMVCRYCATRLNKCPVCRSLINQMVKVYFS